VDNADANVDVDEQQMRCDKRVHVEPQVREARYAYSYPSRRSVSDMICDVVAPTLDDDQHGSGSKGRQLGKGEKLPPANFPYFGGSGPPPPYCHSSFQSMNSSVSDLVALHEHCLQDAGSYTAMDFDTIVTSDAADGVADVLIPREHRTSSFPTQHQQHAQCLLLRRQAKPPSPASAGLRTGNDREIIGPTWNATCSVPRHRRVILAGASCILPSAAEVLKAGTGHSHIDHVISIIVRDTYTSHYNEVTMSAT
jgi:hypothetical protein